jgi:hypothetical protein
MGRLGLVEGPGRIPSPPSWDIAYSSATQRLALGLEPLEAVAGEGPFWTSPALLLADRLLSLTLLAFESLNTAASKDRCLACIEESFFTPLWPLLLALYRYSLQPC